MTSYKNQSILFRWFRIFYVSFKYFVFYKLGKHRKDIFGKRLRYACEELGPIFVKLGQILSTRYDILSNENCSQLQKLLDEVNPLPFETIERIMEKDFGKSYAKIFKSFEKSPVASASISQVHKATLPDGKKVAIKIKRPHIKDTIESDISILKQVVSLAELFSPSLRHLDAKQIMGQLKSWILTEIDFIQEVKNIERMRKYFAHAIEETDTSTEDAGQVIIPEVYEKYCSENVITMEFIEGGTLSKLDSVRNNPEYDIEKSARACCMLSLRHWLTNRKDEVVLHADPHAANLILLPHGKVAMVDFGLIVVFTPEEAQQTADLFLAVYARNLERSIEYALAIANLPYEKYAPVIRSDVAEYLRKAPSSGIGFWFMEFIRIFVKHRLTIPYNLVLFGRQNAVIDGCISTVLPGKTTLDLMGDELEKAMRKRIVQNLLETDISRLAYAVSEEIKKSPDKLVTIVDQLVKDPFKVVKDFHEAAK